MYYVKVSAWGTEQRQRKQKPEEDKQNKRLDWDYITIFYKVLVQYLPGSECHQTSTNSDYISVLRKFKILCMKTRKIYIEEQIRLVVLKPSFVTLLLESS